MHPSTNTSCKRLSWADLRQSNPSQRWPSVRLETGWAVLYGPLPYGPLLPLPLPPSTPACPQQPTSHKVAAMSLSICRDCPVLPPGRQPAPVAAAATSAACFAATTRKAGQQAYGRTSTGSYHHESCHACHVLAGASQPSCLAVILDEPQRAFDLPLCSTSLSAAPPTAARPRAARARKQRPSALTKAPAWPSAALPR